MYEFYQLDKDENIFYFTNSFNCPKQYIELLEEMDKNELSYPYIEKWNNWTASNDNKNIYGQKKHILRSTLSGNENLDKKLLYLINNIFETQYLCTKNYTKIKGIEKFYIRKSFSINKYFSGKSMGPHFDSYEDSTKKTFTILIYLNHDYEGGEIEFPDHNIKIKPEQGSVLIFPTCKPFKHQSHEIKSGNKYFILGEFSLNEYE